ncbi:MAG TPA: DUF6624 domain-containing protein [Baekduia sp.]|nr:DUF6624 domain-containing protein [Baekduia sp.]
MNGALAAELLQMADEDQRIRRPCPTDGEYVTVLSIEEAMEYARVDVGNTDRLRDIVREHGWPGRSLVGEQAAQAAWLLAQHADRQFDFQREVLPLLQRAAAVGEAKPAHVAYLTDRIRMAEGRCQRHGTQIGDIRDGTPVPWPIEDAENVDERRREVGLEPLSDYLSGFAGERPST